MRRCGPRNAPFTNYVSVLTALLVFVLMSCSAAVRADVSVVDGPSGAQRSIEDWYSTHIPAQYKATGSLVVHAFDAPGMLAYLTHSSPSSPHADNTLTPADAQDIDGVYDGGPPRIAVELQDDGSFDTFTFAHEYGHYVWFNMMSKQDRQAYHKIYNQAKSDGHLVTSYAGESQEEGFAEAFSFYVNVPADLQRRDPDSYKFLTEWKKTQ